MSADLDGANIPGPSSLGFALLAGPFAGPVSQVGSPQPLAGQVGGVWAPVHDGQWFERVHVVPRTSDLAFIISEQAIIVEVWNAFRRKNQVLTAIDIDGPAGIEVDNPGGLPDHYPANRAVDYTVRALSEGGARINNVITWVFTAIPTVGTNLTLEGLRIVAFPLPAHVDDDDTMLEAYGYLTDIQEAYDTTEQRAQLRDVPLRGLEFTIVCDSARDAQLANALLYGSQPVPLGVPFWQYMVPLSSDISPGATTIPVDTTDVPFAAGGLAILWRDAHSFEVVSIDTVGASDLTLASGTVQGFAAAGTWVMPLAVGRLSQEERFTWLDLEVGEARLRFELEAVQ